MGTIHKVDWKLSIGDPERKSIQYCTSERSADLDTKRQNKRKLLLQRFIITINGNRVFVRVDSSTFLVNRVGVAESDESERSFF
jgi:hypothetical protein